MLRAGCRKYLTVVETKKFPSGSRVFSLIQPTGRIHLGNYLGAISNWRDMSKSDNDPNTKFIFGTADLHALTTVRDGPGLKIARNEAIASLLAAGLDADRCTIFHQSSVVEHTQLSWILLCLTSIGALNRMTQWKLKASVASNSNITDEDIMGKTKTGILTYPVLQAADILIYKSTHVPVGDDQSQHLELTRNIAQNFNNTYKKDFFPLPKSVLTPTKKILSLRDPSKKMSKSDKDQNGSVYITETPDQISKKIRKATTDSIQGRLYYDPIERPGVSNLINIVSGLSRKPIEETVKDLEWIKDHKQLKDHVTDLIVNEFEGQRHIYDEIVKDSAYLEKIVSEGAEKARAMTAPTMREIEQLVGTN